ncbi:hypothetical protein [Micromonospora craniellae]|uniref:hypothetical protein n=1 Tax=Micromonospora craniellae TaxID=2294034 RepID=UPI0011C0D793|nr:hypothetical protein [Micromonospora craniellae]QOC93420.1 hypothetical protein ID554_07065 [Micromonospora craniellae]
MTGTPNVNGDPERLHQKFRTNAAAGGLSASTAAALLETMSRLSEIDDVATLVPFDAREI